MLTDPLVADAARAVLDGTPVDWNSLESSGDSDTRALTEQLKLLSAIAGVHRLDSSRPSGLPLRRPASTPKTSTGTGHWGHLELLERVGSGAFGDVYRAWDTRLDREVALKLLPVATAQDDDVSPIIEEGRLLARVRHPNVATIYGAERVDDRIGLWMEFIRGRTLEELLRSGHQFSLSDAVAIGVEVCRAASAVHGAGMLHRDIKAQNVMRAEDGRVVLMDFGTGCDRARDESNAAGTPLYLAPEVLRGEPATVQSDVYSVGVLIYHLLTGAYPVHAKTLTELRRAHEEGARVNLADVRPELPPAIRRIIGQAIDADPARRHATCDALAADLVTVRQLPRRRWWMHPVAAAAGVALFAWLGWTALAGSDQNRSPSRAGTAFTPAGLAGASVRPDSAHAIVVLPFRHPGSNPESALIVDGLTYELIRNLAIIDRLDVRSATSSFAFKDKPLDLTEVGRLLGVDLVLEGSVLESDGEWRFHVQLFQVAGDTPLWTGKFDRPAKDVFPVLDEISRAVVNELRLTIGGGQRRYDLDPETSMLYLRARTLTERRGPTGAEAAVKLFGRVIDRDASFAPAYAGLADAYAFLSQDLPDVGGMPPEQALALMRPAAEQAIALDPLLAEAHAALGTLYSREHDWEAAQAAFRRAIELNPSLTHVYADYSITTLMPLGRFDEAERLLEEALRRDPLSPTVLREIAAEQITAGRYDDAIRNLEQVQAVDPDLPFVDLLLARALSFAGRLDEAMPYWEADQSIGRQHWMAYAYVHAGRRAEVERMAAEHTNPYRLAIISAALGDVNGALEALDQAADQSPQRVVRLLVYPEMAPLRDDPRFEAIRAKFRLP